MLAIRVDRTSTVNIDIAVVVENPRDSKDLYGCSSKLSASSWRRPQFLHLNTGHTSDPPQLLKSFSECRRLWMPFSHKPRGELYYAIALDPDQTTESWRLSQRHLRKEHIDLSRISFQKVSTTTNVVQLTELLPLESHAGNVTLK